MTQKADAVGRTGAWYIPGHRRWYEFRPHVDPARHDAGGQLAVSLEVAWAGRGQKRPNRRGGSGTSFGREWCGFLLDEGHESGHN